ncbi:CLUMA_CG003082, isoform A [Clunio marinus]|uniref:CLUMA_CG003082, isoform A n=1 Tax=Clunio marinus TaxID=568069 RepID=A0A1J1HMZ2_9DIPT|nr:CLUMA_CG003082, isoform A [Clunio marinus]
MGRETESSLSDSKHQAENYIDLQKQSKSERSAVSCLFQHLPVVYCVGRNIDKGLELMITIIIAKHDLKHKILCRRGKKKERIFLLR